MCAAVGNGRSNCTILAQTLTGMIDQMPPGDEYRRKGG